MRCERGYTLTEALVSVVLLIVVLGGTLSLLDTTAQIAPEENERAHAVRDAQVGLATMTRELRQARIVYSHDGHSMEVRTPVNGVPVRVRYDCSAVSQSIGGFNACQRVVHDQNDDPVSTTYPLDRVIDEDVFTYTEQNGVPTFVQVRIEVPASGERKQGLDHEIVLDDGFYLRNLGEG